MDVPQKQFSQFKSNKGWIYLGRGRGEVGLSVLEKHNAEFLFFFSNISIWIRKISALEKLPTITFNKIIKPFWPTDLIKLYWLRNNKMPLVQCILKMIPLTNLVTLTNLFNISQLNTMQCYLVKYTKKLFWISKICLVIYLDICGSGSKLINSINS